jgi:hypothetical protein
MKRRHTDAADAEPVEEHDSGFVGVMTLFDTFPHNDTFDELRELELIAAPVDSQANIYTFIHNKQDYGIMTTEDMMLKAKIKIHTTANGNAPADTQVVVLCPAPLRLGWKSMNYVG